MLADCCTCAAIKPGSDEGISGAVSELEQRVGINRCGARPVVAEVIPDGRNETPIDAAQMIGECFGALMFHRGDAEIAASGILADIPQVQSKLALVELNELTV